MSDVFVDALMIACLYPHSGVIPVLMNLIEPPDMTNVSKSFDVLHGVGMISIPNDDGLLTETGKMAGSLPVDLYLSRMIAYGNGIYGYTVSLE